MFIFIFLSLFVLSLFIQFIWPIYLLLIFICILAMFLSFEKLIYFVLTGGLFSDFFSNNYLGITPLILFSLIGIYFVFNYYINLVNFYGFIAFLFLVLIIYSYLTSFNLYFWQIFYNLVFGIVFYLIYLRWQKYLEKAI